MIIFGSRGIRRKGESGTFFCPQCNGARQYTRQKMRRFFTLYFIPIIPLDVIGEYIECNYCHGTFRPEILQYDPGADQKRGDMQVRTAIRRALLTVLVADGTPSAAARSSALDAMRSLGGESSMTASDLDALIASMKKGTSAAGDVEAIADHLGYAAREALLRAAVTIAQADGAMTSNEETQIRALAKAAQITDAHLTGIIATSPRMAGAPAS